MNAHRQLLKSSLHSVLLHRVHKAVLLTELQDQLLKLKSDEKFLDRSCQIHLQSGHLAGGLWSTLCYNRIPASNGITVEAF